MADVHAIPVVGWDLAGNEGFDPASGQLILQHMRTEYLEMPGLSLDISQAARLWNITVATSEQLLGHLRQDGFLAITAAGRYVRA